MGKGNNKQQLEAIRLRQKEVQQKQTKRLIWIAIACVALIAVIILLVVPKSSAGTPASFPYEQLPALGNSDAPVKIVEFGDFKCPSCQMFNTVIKPQLEKDYIEQGVASLHFVNFPFIGIDSTTAALAVQAAYHQNADAYWPFVDTIFEHQQNEKLNWATPEYLVELAQDAGLELDFNLLLTDITDKTYQNEVNEHFALGEKLLLSSTPTVYVNGIKVKNALDYKELTKAIEAAKGE